MVSWLGRLAAYFDLREPFAKTGEEWFGQPTFAGRPRKIAQRDGAMWLLGVYLAELAGVVSKQVWNDLAAGQRLRLQWESLLLASIIATATLPAVYRAVARVERVFGCSSPFNTGSVGRACLAS